MLPAPGVSRLRIKAPIRARHPVPVETRFSMRPFARQRREPAFQLVPAAKSLPLACIFDAIRKLRRTRSVLHSRPHPAFYLLGEARSTRKTRCPIPFPDFPAVSRPPLPSRTSRSFGIKALNPVPTRKAYFCELPDLPSLPAPRKFLRSPRNGSLFRIRYFPPSLLSLEPLGTNPIMHLKDIGVNMKLAFPSVIFCL